MSKHISDVECDHMAAFFSIFANPTRLKIFCALQSGARTVSELAELAGAALPNVSQHLRMMRDNGAVKSERKGQNVRYSIVDDRFVDAARLIRDALQDEWKRRAAVKPSKRR